MSKAYEFLKECGAFFVLSINGEYPAGRPFGAVMEVGEDLFLSTNDMNEAHKQMRENEHIQIVAKKAESREWIRITGIATECDNQDLKQRMLELRSLHKGLNANLYQCHSLMEWIYNRTGNRGIENVMVKIQNF